MFLELWFDQYAQYPRKVLLYGYHWQSKKIFRRRFLEFERSVNVSHIIKSNGYTETNGVCISKIIFGIAIFLIPFWARSRTRSS